MRFAARLLQDDPQVVATIAEGVAARDERSAAARALAALARYESGQVDRRMLALLDDAMRLNAPAPDPDAQPWIARLSDMMERGQGTARLRATTEGRLRVTRDPAAVPALTMTAIARTVQSIMDGPVGSNAHPRDGVLCGQATGCGEFGVRQ